MENWLSLTEYLLLKQIRKQVYQGFKKAQMIMSFHRKWWESGGLPSAVSVSTVVIHYALSSQFHELKCLTFTKKQKSLFSMMTNDSSNKRKLKNKYWNEQDLNFLLNVIQSFFFQMLTIKTEITLNSLAEIIDKKLSGFYK